MRNKRAAAQGDAGFTLLEVLVAFIIAALALALLFQGASAGLSAARIAGHYEEAISRAKSRLAAIGVEGALRPGEQAGDDGGGFAWRMRVTQVSSNAATPALGGQPDAQAPRIALYSVSVSISWDLDGSRRQVQLDTERVGLTAAAPP